MPLPPEGVRTRYCLRIKVAGTGGDITAWNAQLDLVRASGATYDRDRETWWLVLDAELSAHAKELVPLMAAARDHGTQVRIERILRW
jgi:hypothetical protein